VSKELDINELKNLKLDVNSKEIKNYLKEYNNLKKLFSSFLGANFPYVSIAYGGFFEVHNLSIKYSIPLLNHKTTTCKICSGKKKPKISSSGNFFSKMFNWKSNDKTDNIDTGEAEFETKESKDESGDYRLSPGKRRNIESSLNNTQIKNVKEVMNEVI